ncbi:aldehyde dehydrogenase family protein [Streptomyces sp. NPDC058000]|uniref:aldehyde dehydrogenase family protein n=1 Tax=Streptomyces sp. NPDC058000 TaxID=3346299 RepID=UPI0036E76932
MGDPADPTTVCGPLIDERARSRVTEARRGLSELAGVPAPARNDGWYAAPALVENVPPGHPLLHQEVFGPLAVLLRADDLDHAVRIANSVPYGLVASVHTASLDTALHGLDRLDTGMIRVNAPSTGVDFHLPFGGTKASSLGPREQGGAALDFYTSTRTYGLARTPVGRCQNNVTLYPGDPLGHEGQGTKGNTTTWATSRSATSTPPGSGCATRSPTTYGPP